MGSARRREALDAQAVGLTHFQLLPGREAPSRIATREQKTPTSSSAVAAESSSMKSSSKSDVGHYPRRATAQTARAFEAGPDGLEFIAVGPHHPGDGESVEDPWTE